MKTRNSVMFFVGLNIAVCFFGCGTAEKELARTDLTSTIDTKTNIPFFTLDGKPFTGVTTDVLEDSGVKLVAHYKNGLQHGKLTGWHPNGNKEREFYFVKGVPEGTQLGFYANGQKYFESFYVDGKLDGTVNHWNETGVLQLMIEYREGLEIARIQYDEEGNKIENNKMQDSLQ